MANWWLPLAMLRVLVKLQKRYVLLFDSERDKYYWKADKKACSPTAKTLVNRGLICSSGDGRTMRITPTGINELGYNKGRVKLVEGNADA
ncbi:hypothetical protein V9T10_000167 [Yersinia enterocolitica]|uniref:hypothetical protein n=1 Tax=Yersinia TaxID=629 RepID=UPI0005E21463|nr:MULTISPECIES: hypothetical protein [Yersinia]MCW6576463.1 hypothetical protein [Yersinia ruckeri]CQH79452.1 Uncharacterised protein [Yersinia enterocolitica]